MKMPRLTRTTVCCLLLSSVIGCQGPWQAFEEIEVGKPVPDDGIFRREARKGGFEWAWVDTCSARFPVSGGHSTVRILQDKQGDVVVKEYQAMAGGHWLLFQAAAWRWVLEVEVPEHAWHSPPDGWKTPSSDEGAKTHERVLELMNVLRPLTSEGDDFYERTVLSPEVQDSLETGVRLYKRAFAISRQRVAKHVLDRIDGGQGSVAVDIEKHISLDGFPKARQVDWSDIKARVYVEDDPKLPALFLEIAIPVAGPRASNVLEWIQHVRNIRDGQLPDSPRDDRGKLETYVGLSEFFANQLFALSMYLGGRMIGLYELADRPELFYGVTRKGFDRTYTNPWGGTCRVQNLGGRRIRVEADAFVLLDAFMLLAHAQIEREPKITDQDGKTTYAKGADYEQGRQ